MKKPETIVELEEHFKCEFRKVNGIRDFILIGENYCEYVTDDKNNIVGIGLFSLNMVRMPDLINRFNTIKSLTIISCNLQEISPLSNFKKLIYLDISFNKISNISALKELIQLEELHLEDNPIDEIPDWICNYPKMEINWGYGWTNGLLNLYNNPVKNLPVEIIKRGKHAMKRYFEKLGTNK